MPEYDSIPKPAQTTEPPTNFELVMGEAVDPLTRIRGWDDSRFERLIHEWAFTLMDAKKYGKVVWAPGSGDKGRDIRAYLIDEKGEYDNYQCKFYKDPLTPGDAWLELAKLCLHTHRNTYLKPRKYYFVAPRDIGPDLSTLLENPEELRRQLIANWEKTGKGSISEKITPFDDDLRTYVNSFDFGIITYKPQREIVDDLKGTEYYRRVFGCGGLRRPKPEPIPETPTAKEAHYVQALRAAFAEHLRIDASALSETVLQAQPNLISFLRMSRICFYSAEQLYRFGRDTFPSAHCFEDLQEQVYIGIHGTSLGTFKDGFERARVVTSEAGKLQLGNHFLVGLNLVTVNDRHGICHQIVNANDGRLNWVQTEPTSEDNEE